MDEFMKNINFILHKKYFFPSIPVMNICYLADREV